MYAEGELQSEVLVNSNSFKSLYLKGIQDVITLALLGKKNCRILNFK